MKKHRRESVESWEQDLRDFAKAERELEIEHWVFISIEYQSAARERVKLYSYDLPRGLYERYRWVIRWRISRFQCQYPREYVTALFSYYDKRTGLKIDHNSCLSKLAAAKAQITKAERCIEQHIAAQRQKYPMFYDENSDTELIAYRAKLEHKKQNCQTIKENLRQAVEQHRLQTQSADTMPICFQAKTPPPVHIRL